MKKYMHLTLDERNIIEQELNNNKSFKDIAILFDKDPTTILKEIVSLKKVKQFIHLQIFVVEDLIVKRNVYAKIIVIFIAKIVLIVTKFAQTSLMVLVLD